MTDGERPRVADGERPSGPIDVATLELLAQRADSHPLVEDWALQPDALSPRQLEVRLDPRQYPDDVTAARLDVRWFEGGDYTFHYLESHDETVWQWRWDRHPKPDEPRTHVHPPPDAAADVEKSGIEETHHLGVLFAVLEFVESRVATLHEA